MKGDKLVGIAIAVIVVICLVMTLSVCKVAAKDDEMNGRNN